MTALREARTAKGRFTVKYRSLANLRCLYYDFSVQLNGWAAAILYYRGISGSLPIDHIWPLSTIGFRHHRLAGCYYVVRVHTPTIGDVAGRSSLPFTGASGQSNPNVALFPGFSNQRDREIEHRRHPTPPTIDQTCRNHQAGRALGYRSVTSVDGTRLRAWDNDGHGVPVLISNGLGTPHHAWPDINGRTDTYRVMTWDHRGLGGSERPSDESRISISTTPTTFSR